jgi:hypothetical protein
MQVHYRAGRPRSISLLEKDLSAGIPLRFDDHCLACAAGEGSGCFGRTAGACCQDRPGQ